MDDYSFLDVIWTMILFFLFILWIFLVIRIFMDIFRQDMSGWGKAAWSIFIIVLPFLGVLMKREGDVESAAAAHRRGRVN